MSDEQLKAFVEKAKSDAELLKKLKTGASEAVAEIAKQEGFSVTPEELELSDQELEGAAGGCGGVSGCFMFSDIG